MQSLKIEKKKHNINNGEIRTKVELQNFQTTKIDEKTSINIVKSSEKLEKRRKVEK